MLKTKKLEGWRVEIGSLRLKGGRRKKVEDPQPVDPGQVLSEEDGRIVIDLRGPLPNIDGLLEEVERVAYAVAYRRAEGSVARAGRLLGVRERSRAILAFKYLHGFAERRSPLRARRRHES